MQNLLPIHVLDKNPEWLCSSVHLRVPLKVRCDGQLDHQARTCNRLHVGTQIQLGELVHQLVDGLAHLGESNQLANLCTGQVVVALPRKILLLNLPEDILCQALEVSQRSLASPHSLVDHLAPVQSPKRQRSPSSSQANLKDRAHDAPCRLLHIDHVGHQCETIQLQLRNVGLQKHVDLAGRFVSASLDWHRHALHQLLHLHFLLFTHGDVLELVGEGEEPQ
mmetsp:Transcript_46130/g.103670  ORF Transcript_46130/g.103670 Transcript_46130/m.103670 type:complete len:222 (+) Transcript_46130:2760-3425(+)